MTQSPYMAACTILALVMAPTSASSTDGPSMTTVCASQSETKDAHISCLEKAVLALEKANIALPLASLPSQQTEIPAEPIVSGIGAEQVVNKRVINGKLEKKERREEQSRIAEHGKTSSGLLLIFLDNGQIWRQKRSDNAKIHLRKKGNYTVTVIEGAVSGYKMKIHEAHKSIRVERLK